MTPRYNRPISETNKHFGKRIRLIRRRKKKSNRAKIPITKRYTST